MSKQHGDAAWEFLEEAVPNVLWYIFCGPFVLLGYILGGLFSLCVVLFIGLGYVLHEKGCGCLVLLVIMAGAVVGLVATFWR